MHADRQRHAADPDRGRGLPQRVVQPPESAGPQQAAARLAGGLSPATALSLQRAIGNAAVARLVDRERHQHSADCGHGATVQRSVDDQSVQRDALERVDAVTRASGSPLRTDVRRRMESDYGGEDFSDVRVHVDRSSAEAVGARAYTTKTHHIVFRSAADMDDHTMRHELQHVRQQRAGAVPSGISDPTDAWERDAESTATKLGQRPAGVQRSVAPELNHTSAQGVAVQRMPSSGSQRERRQRPSVSECRIEGRGSGFRVWVSRPSSPAHSPHDETGPTSNNFLNQESAIGHQGGVRYDRSVIQYLGGVITGETETASNNYLNQGAAILNQGYTQYRSTVTQYLGSGSRSRRRVVRGGNAPATNNFSNYDSTIGTQGSEILHQGAVVRVRGGRVIPDQGRVSHPGGLHVMDLSQSTMNNLGTGNLLAANYISQRRSGDTDRDRGTNWEFHSPTENFHGRMQYHGNTFNAGDGSIVFDGGDTAGDFERVDRRSVLTIGNDVDTGGEDFRHRGGGGVYNANFIVGSRITGSTFDMFGDEDSIREGAISPPAIPDEEFRTQRPTVLNFEGDFTVEGDASMFIGNVFDADNFSAWSRRQGGRRGEQGADHTEGGFPDYTREDLYIGNTFRILGGTITLSGGVYLHNSFSADRIIIRGNAVFVGGNTFDGEVEVENADQMAQEIYVGHIAHRPAGRVTPL
ncbi:DUF4157 domain-containing protein [Streptomyces sp. DSM 15324]|uniref:eCIS core domain-containing protein n=1 Tax=Streptomyces sp. DSM 15324 TaxID=1739111 RepID=UPI000749BBDE|nr:DUF4157 domain-containing protein [Streptomyces sp. DSM 15324]KUO09786.1 hypothetical protein AQJ58_22275 [Streptomyces sp. DSM 15324]